MGLVYRFLYSTNYDNYKIIENILTKQFRVNINPSKNEKEIENIELKTDLIDNSSEVNDNHIEKIEEGDNKPKNGSSEEIDLPPLKFYDFLFHIFYSKCCGLSSKQSLINSCNNIVS